MNARGPDRRSPLRLAGLCAGTLALTSVQGFSGTAGSQPARASERVPAPSTPSSLHARDWSQVDLAFDRAKRVPGLVGSRCVPRGSPASTLFTDSRRLTGLGLKRFTTGALRSREFLALDRALNERGFRPLLSEPYGRASLKEKLIVVPYADSSGHGAFAGLLVGNGRRQAEARFTDTEAWGLPINQPTLTIDMNTGSDSLLTARAAALDPLCLRICVRGAARCATGISRCVPLASLPVGGTAAFLACAAVVCGPDTLSCIRKCL